MDLAEVAERVRRAASHAAGGPSARRARALERAAVRDAARASFPPLPDRDRAPAAVRTAAARAVDHALAARWKAFGSLEFTLDDPPRWQRDALAGVDLASTLPGSRLDPSRPPHHADVRLVWELNRWDALFQLAVGAWLGRPEAAERCLKWLEHWDSANPPFQGWNWTSALESGLRLVQLAWIDALLDSSLADDDDRRARLDRAVRRLVAPHIWFTWSERSFGSSANNHLLGELTGLLVAAVRWPEVAAAASLSPEFLGSALERQALAQFAPDGGNREQALHYHLFAFELCWHAARALAAAGRALSPAASERLERAAAFYAAVQVEGEPWDYGDSDDAAVTNFPIDAAAGDSRLPWSAWLRGDPAGDALSYWLGQPPRVLIGGTGSPPSRAAAIEPAWAVFPDSGIAVRREQSWFARLDASPLGYLSTAAHGHLDALHLSLWLDGVAVVIDPGTGTYYADPRLRELLASRRAHNGPCPIGLDRPRRLGPFLWSEHHPVPALSAGADGSIEASLSTGVGPLRRSVRFDSQDGAWVVSDRADRGADFWVRWQLAPGAVVEAIGERVWRIGRGGISVALAAGGPWAETTTGTAPVSPSFRVVTEAPFIALRAGGAAASGELHTTFRRAP